MPDNQAAPNWVVSVIAVWGEISKSVSISWTYRVNTLTSLLTLGFIFVVIGFFVGQGAMDPTQMPSTLLGYLTWMYAALAISDLSGGLRSEMSAGTLEQMAMSPAPIGVILLGRVVANFILTTLQVMVMGAVMALLFGIRVPLTWESLPVLAITLAGILGFGFLIAGAVLVFQHVVSFVNLMNNALAFMNGTFLPIASMPGWMAALSRTLPSTQGVIVLRRVTLQGATLAQVWQDGSLLWLLVHSAIYLTVGWIVFGICERVAKERGTLGQY